MESNQFEEGTLDQHCTSSMPHFNWHLLVSQHHISCIGIGESPLKQMATGDEEEQKIPLEMTEINEDEEILSMIESDAKAYKSSLVLNDEAAIKTMQKALRLNSEDSELKKSIKLERVAQLQQTLSKDWEGDDGAILQLKEAITPK